MHDDFDDLTEDDWSRIDEAMWGHGDAPVVDKGKAKSDVHFDDLTEGDWSKSDQLLPAMNREGGSDTHEDESLAGSSGRVGEPTSGRGERSNTLAASSSANSQIGGAFPPDAAMHDDFDDLTEDDWSRIDEVMWGHGDTPVVDKGKAKSDVRDVALPATAIGHPSEAMPRSVPLRTFERVEVGDKLLIGHESNSEWHHSMLFETPQQHFRRVGRWLDKEEYDQMSVLIKSDDPEGAYSPRNRLFSQLGRQRYIEKMDELGLSHRVFGSVRSPGPHSYDTPAGRRTALHNYEFPLQTGNYNPDILIRNDGVVIGLWPKLVDAKTLASLTQEFGADNVWLKAADNTYLTECAYNHKEREGAEGAFAKFIARDDAIERDDLLIGHESNSEWDHSMFFETPQQHFRRVGRWLDKEEYDQMSVLIKSDDPEGAYSPRNRLFSQLGRQRYIEKMDELGLSHRVFGSVRSPGPHSYDTPAGRRTALHNYEFPLQTGNYNPDILIRNDGVFIGLWPKLVDVKTLASLTQKYGADNVWLKAADNTYMTERAYNHKEREGAEGAFAKFIARDDVIQCSHEHDRKRLRDTDIGR
ncbi:hypothetical protein NLM33_48035 (plasmid) [Bradyrhizobium sp. CCGUVB1N3]|uniref:hypothetical protein n=1 Tax=Bradyrhizobium sp. CCGUVB1N3 TaxID=2949629 RepID=UPI0020B249E7|nr:hypothetical protein [Bradyrhizobium sp. CCGUVB1N3]MCP3477843.1 hypothetical protein [Bradyrhizobium sp. CCGUVB1N3]